MDTTLSITQVFLIGFASTLHCLGMCGGISGALSMSLPADIRQQRERMLFFVSLLNVGRLLSYALAGAISGAFGISLLQAIGLDHAHEILRYLGAAFMAAIGLYLAGWLPQLSQLEHLGQPVWKRLQPVIQALMPINSISRAILYGMLWGWLPCGLVYMMLLISVTAGSASHGALMMLAFGLGTLPVMVLAGMLTGWIRRLGSQQRLRQIVGLIIVIMALASLFFTPLDHSHHVM